MTSAAPNRYPRATLPPRKLLRLPLKSPSDSLQSSLDDYNGLLGSMPEQDAVFYYLQGCDPSSDLAEFVSLRHELSAYIHKPPIDFDEIVSAERLEENIYRQWRIDLPQRISLEDIKRLNALATGGDGEFRRTRAYLASNDGSPFIPMVDWREAHERLTELTMLFEAGEFGHGVLAGTRILALINNAHAFPDGNGRLGRFLFNLCLHRIGMPSSSYIPLKSLAILAQGGYEIRHNGVVLFDHWDELISYHCNAIRLVHQMGDLSIIPRKVNSADVQ